MDKDRLLALHAPGPERVGFVLEDGEIVEVENVCHDPENGFEVRPEDLLPYLDRMVATWHTHPDASANLSMNDYETFRGWPNLKHYIIGKDGVRRYGVRNGKVFLA